MPSVIEAPDRIEEEQWPNGQDVVQTVPMVSPAPRRRLWRTLAAYLTAFVASTRQGPQQSQPEMHPLDRLARDNPYLYILTICS